MTTKLTTIKIMTKILFTGLALLFVQLSFAAPKIENWTTDSGLRVYYVNVPELPMLDLRLTFAAGSAYDGEKMGISGMTTSMLSKGAAGLNADQIAEAFETVGAEFSTGTGLDSAWINLRSLTFEEQLEPALQNWLKVIQKPNFPEADFARLKKQALVGLEAEKQDPGSIASKAFYANLYAGHPYSQPQNGNEKTIDALTIDELKAFFKQYYVNKNAQLALVGSISKEQAKKIALQVSNALLDGDRGVGEKAADIPPVKPLTEAKVVHIPFPSSQAHVMIGQPGNKRGDKDYFTLYLGNHGLGGSGFTSRLMKEIRVKRGLSYSVYSYFIPMKENGPFMLGLQTKLSQTDEAIKVARDVLNTFQKDGPSEEDLAASKLNITGGFPLRTASNSDIIGYIDMIGFYGLPLDYLDTFTKTINAITRDQVVDAFKRRLDTDKLLTIIVGGEAKDEESSASKDTAEKAPDLTKAPVLLAANEATAKAGNETATDEAAEDDAAEDETAEDEDEEPDCD
ncbi:pitrilysin family protein [Cocleimonas sp. KMM 6892]|uniref:M16 family metallopeptidase n=1 Tax=unclassified Cocleimonas TaxID=2639732 RepID=UPI002DBD9BD9|nr:MULTISPECIES: pitrilysin family protein [unclassified Cocleimonas]MEB8431174.1 pitrilysin family protein [Cocleimonas sp. KMM 6892]MEC4714054.1 pitrilysin family protein [Cocleimonas sp. KMM 6895]MEC4743385.1 pitrilysin family protein [Cocleimonas sp. KMM 6896]